MVALHRQLAVVKPQQQRRLSSTSAPTNQARANVTVNGIRYNAIWRGARKSTAEYLVPLVVNSLTLNSWCNMAQNRSMYTAAPQTAACRV